MPTDASHPDYSPATALIVVDMQHDFADPAGSLYVRGGEDLLPGIVAEIERTREAGGPVLYTQDWHPKHTPHFAADGGIWPVHCVMGTPGAEFVPGLPVEGPVVRKGSGPEDGYSGFSVLDLRTGHTHETELDSMLADRNVTALRIVGLAGDYCVKATAIDAVGLGYAAIVPLRLTRFVELHPGDRDAAVEAMAEAGVELED
ncbi:isochorismatase family protein [Nakamurella endophytica]|uniref:nicotinamidase n=1 Tax=Nakamurella endophytica TaxID=1748367 RepID=A0A917T1V3_9ACTN|nr:isochorismatase family protein [Nakamurella endophytica]GGM07325.1 nicotinamidase [Nakamurella endophytica]